MKSVSKFLSLLTLSLAAGGLAAPAHAFDVQYEYPAQTQIESRTVTATHTFNSTMLRTSPMMAEAMPQIAEVIMFDTKSDKLKPAGVAQVKKVATWLKGGIFAGKRVVISGYTDAAGKEPVNQRLSYHRAVAVQKALIAEGVSAGQLVAQGFGSSNPVASNATPQGRAANRRVTFTVVCAPPAAVASAPTASMKHKHHHHKHNHPAAK